jgi:hypothetical protein
MIIQRLASDGQPFGCIWTRHCGGKNGLSWWLWVCNAVTTVMYLIGNRSPEILSMPCRGQSRGCLTSCGYGAPGSPFHRTPIAHGYRLHPRMT